ncbi:hypothetical protein KP509_1Z141600 [Ceratopteris richardii]|nr:hypothetical protein KP509_1Z141600 [Ceratopteris richardii]
MSGRLAAAWFSDGSSPESEPTKTGGIRLYVAEAEDECEERQYAAFCRCRCARNTNSFASLPLSHRRKMADAEIILMLKYFGTFYVIHALNAIYRYRGLIGTVSPKIRRFTPQSLPRRRKML